MMVGGQGTGILDYSVYVVEVEGVEEMLFDQVYVGCFGLGHSDGKTLFHRCPGKGLAREIPRCQQDFITEERGRNRGGLNPRKSSHTATVM